MSQNDNSENDIWDYKPLKKKKKQEPPLDPKSVAKRRCTTTGGSKGHTSTPAPSPVSKINITTRLTKSKNYEQAEDEDCSIDTINTHPKSSTFQTCDNDTEGTCGEYCPVCQMPFSILIVQSQRWHVLDCLDFSRNTCKECPDGLLCSSTFPSHYRNYNHTLLAHSRGIGGVLSSQTTTRESNHPGPTITEETNPCGQVNNQMDQAGLNTSQNSSSICPLLPSCSSSSPLNNHTKPPKISNGLLLLRSPAPEDLKKKKGWSSPKVQRAVSSFQESKTEISFTPGKTANRAQPSNSVLKSAPSPPEIDDAISYSPLSELPVEPEFRQAGPRKTLFKIDPGGTENDDSIVAFSESEDDILVELLDTFESLKEEEKVTTTLIAQVNSVSPSQSNQEAANKAVDKCKKEKSGTCTSVVSYSENSIQSPQSIVLERLRETISNSGKSFCEGRTIQSEKLDSEKETCSQKMTPQKTRSKAGQATGLKQTDIGVFFGLKPLHDKITKIEPQQLPALAESEKQEGKIQTKGRQRKSQVSTTAENPPSVSTTVENGTGEETKRTGTRRWRRKTTTTDGEVQKFRRCPFYKKIPGTKLVVDAFRYGLIEGISAYFLTHFHSDHYDGLSKNSTCPIYCNKITGNLVKSKLKVPEQYVHILPMNQEVIVEGIKVILLEANHCPGAAMLLFFLPDGQTVLHTGDFRADPSMETYPELLNCSVQTLYLDTTYCSPEYTFPKQQEVINYAANTAFELVTLNPRTLVVCGSYSVGKEKVFLALADVLGSKVSLSRDKYNTMCCLESEEVRQRITTDWKAAQIHVLPMMQLSFKKLQSHLARFSAKYDKLVAFKPTGWTFSHQVESVEDIQPHINGNISIYGIPYSEHSSFLELKRFVQWLKPLKIIPTVNNGSWDSRKAMERCFSEWQMETRSKL